MSRKGKKEKEAKTEAERREMIKKKVENDLTKKEIWNVNEEYKKKFQKLKEKYKEKIIKWESENFDEKPIEIERSLTGKVKIIQDIDEVEMYKKFEDEIGMEVWNTRNKIDEITTGIIADIPYGSRLNKSENKPRYIYSTKKNIDRYYEAKKEYSMLYQRIRSWASEENIKKRIEKVKPLQQKLKELNKKQRKINQKKYKAQKKAKEEEKKAFDEGRYEDVSDDLIRDHLLPKYYKIRDKSSRYRAVVAVEHGYKESDKKPLFTGIDDNEEKWSIDIESLTPLDARDLGFYEYDDIGLMRFYASVEDVMSLLFNVPENMIKNKKTQRQGDILVTKAYDLEEMTDGEEWEQIKDKGINSSHRIKGTAEFIEIEYDDGSDFYETQTITYMRNEKTVILDHSAHENLTISPGVWKISPHISIRRHRGWD
ncbi:MAG: hypothetical protein ACOC8Y_05900 [Candidatus Natronoplasma sp.]